MTIEYHIWMENVRFNGEGLKKFNRTGKMQILVKKFKFQYIYKYLSHAIYFSSIKISTNQLIRSCAHYGVMTTISSIKN